MPGILFFGPFLAFEVDHAVRTLSWNRVRRASIRAVSVTPYRIADAFRCAEHHHRSGAILIVGCRSVGDRDRGGSAVDGVRPDTRAVGIPRWCARPVSVQEGRRGMRLGSCSGPRHVSIAASRTSADARNGVLQRGRRERRRGNKKPRERTPGVDAVLERKRYFTIIILMFFSTLPAFIRKMYEPLAT